MATPTDPPPPGDDEHDAIAQVTPVRRVEGIGTLVVAIHPEGAPPAADKPARRGMELVLKPFTPDAPMQRLSTMSDFTDQANPLQHRHVARVRDRHFASKPRKAGEVPGSDPTPTP